LNRSGASSGLPACILLYVLSRGLLLAAGLVGPSILSPGRGLQRGNLQRSWTGPESLEIWARWDSEWYLLIAERGYHLEPQMSGRNVAYEAADATGFFPLYPGMIRGVAAALEWIPAVRGLRVTPWAPRDPADPAPGGAALLLAGILISEGSLLGTILLLHNRVRAVTGSGGIAANEPSPDRVAIFSCAALLFFPPSMFLSAVYAESLLLLLTLLCFKFLRDRRWVAASIAGALASATKPTGLLLLVPAALTVARARVAEPQTPRAAAAAAWATLPIYPAGAAAFSLYCSRAFGDPLTWLHRQGRWRGAVSGPWRAFQRWAEHPQIHGAHGSTVELAFAILVLSLLLAALWRRPPAESIFAAAVAVPPLCSTLWSYGRLSLQAFPLFIVMGKAMARHRWIAALYISLGAAGSSVLMAYFGAWYWAG
jgi:hypothetical protein